MIKLPTYELFLTDEEQVELALVNSPAIEFDFIYFNEDKIKMEFNDEEMIVKGAALIPNQMVYRNDNLGERNVFMSEKTVQQFAEYLINKQGNKFNLGHSDNKLEAIIVESYFATDINEFNVPKGSWIIALKIKSKEVWERVKTSEFKGFSIQGIFANELTNFTINKTNKEIMNLKEKLQAAINAVLFAEENPTPEVEAPVVDKPVVETPVAEDEKPLTREDVAAMIEADIIVAIELVMSDVSARIEALREELTGSVKVIDDKVEEFGKQPISLPIKEEIKIAKGDFGYLAGINK